MDLSGAYTEDRAAALSGVPRSTVRYWAAKVIVVPSISPERVRLWSYADLFSLRTVHWLRRKKTSAAGHEVPATAMPAVKRALGRLRSLGLDVFHEGRPTILVAEDGRVLIHPPGEPHAHDADGQIVSGRLLDVLAPFETHAKTRGVDLQRPSEHVRILPRKLSGATHIVDTRIDTEGLAALARRGFDAEHIVRLYPDLDVAQVRDALALEDRLALNLAA